MRSSVRNWLLMCLVLACFEGFAAAQCQCTCRPSPPGGTTQCSHGQIAVCGGSGDGTCRGSCISPLTSGAAGKTWSADSGAIDMLRQILHVHITRRDVEGNRTAFDKALDKLIESSKSTEPVRIEFNQGVFVGNVGLSEDAEKQLKEARYRGGEGPVAELKKK